jgi:hypothetical protein
MNELSMLWELVLDWLGREDAVELPRREPPDQ